MKKESKFTTPNHRVLSSKKTEEDYFGPTADYYIKHAGFGSSYYAEMETLMDAASGVIADAHYSYVTNPANAVQDQYKRLPAKLRNYDLIGPVINFFLGECLRRPDSAIVTAPGASSESEFKRKKVKAMTALLAQDIVNNLNDAGIDTGVPSKDIGDYKEESDTFDKTFEDEVAIIGQEALTYLVQALKVDEKIQRLFFDWLAVGYCVTYKDVNHNDVVYEDCNPRSVYFFDMPESGLGEDAGAAVYVKTMSRAELVAAYGNELENKKTDDGKTYLEMIESRTFGGVSTFGPSTLPRASADMQMQQFINETKCIVHVVTWQGLKKVGKLTYTDMLTGQITMKEVDDTYMFEPELGDIDIEWEWINCSYITHVVDKDLYLKMEECLVQRNEINNVSENKLPFNCKVYGYRTMEIRSVTKIGLNYNILYNIVHFRFEFMLAKYRNKMSTFPVGLIPKKNGWTEERWFYWANIFDILMFDESMPGAANAMQGIKDVGGALASFITDMWEILALIKQEWWDAIGMNRQRFGGVLASDGKGTNEMAISQSSIISEDMFFQFDKFLESEYDGLIDNSKVAWVDGVKGMYTTSDKARALFVLDGERYLKFANTSFGTFVSNSRHELEKINQAKALAQPFIQNQLGALGAIEMLDANNYSKIKEIAGRALKAERAFQANMKREEMRSNEAIQSAKSQDAQMASEDKRYVADTQAAATIEAAKIGAGVNLQKLYTDTINKRMELGDELGEDKMDGLSKQLDSLKLSHTERNLDLKKRGIDAKMYGDSIKLAVAKENKDR